MIEKITHTIQKRLLSELTECIIIGPSGSDMKGSIMESGQIPYLNGKNIVFPHFQDYDYKFVDKNHWLSKSNKIAKPDDIVIIHVGSIGKCTVIPTDSKYSGYLLSINQTLIRCNELLLPKYLLYYLNCREAQYYIESNKMATGVPQIARPVFTLSSMMIPWRPINDQFAIVNCIEQLDSLRNTLIKINDNLEALCQTKYESMMSKLMDDYEECQLSEYGEIVGGSTPSKAITDYYTDSGIAWLTPKDLSDNKTKFIGKGSIDITKDGLKNSSARLMPRGTILYTSRAPIGYIAIAKNDITTNQGFKSVIPKDDCYRSFIYYYLKNNYELINGLASGSTFMEISGTAMKNVPIPRISSEELESFEAYCSSLFDYQEQLELEIESLTQLRDYLLPRLMSGEIDVSSLEIPN